VTATGRLLSTFGRRRIIAAQQFATSAQVAASARGLGRVKTIFGRPDAFGLHQDRPQEPF